MHRVASRPSPKRALVLILAVAVVVATTTTFFTHSAQADVTSAFAPRFAANVNGSIILRGNTNLVCDAVNDSACAAGQNGTGTGDALNNNGYVMQNAKADNSAGTFNNSTAAVSVPAGSTVLFAGLYWSADPTAGTSGTAAPDATKTGDVLFRTPAGSTWNAVHADKLYTATSITAYQGFADVTALVAGNPNGDFSVANIQAGLGKDRYAGWSLAIAYQNSAEPLHSLRIWDGFGVVRGNSTQAQIPISGFQTPHTGTVGAKVGTVVYEGDLGKTGDTLSIDGKPISDAVNPVNNVFNSTISDSGALVSSGRNPSFRNLMGIDIDQFDVGGKLTNDQTSTTLTLTTAANGETYYPGVVTFTTDLFAPDVVTTPSGTDLNGGDLLPGDIIEYRIDVRNDGTDAADAISLTDAVPAHTTYVPGSLTLHGAPVTDTADGDAGKISGNAASWTLPSLAYQSSNYVTFRVKVDYDAPGGFAVTDTANTSYVAHTSQMTISGGSAGTTMTVRQPDADLAGAVAVTPAYVQRADAPAAVTYDLTVTNNGGELEPAAKGELTLPAGVTPAAMLPAGCAALGQVVTCDLGPLAAGTSSVTVSIPATATSAAAARPVASLHAFGLGHDAVAANDTATVTLAVNSPPAAQDDTANASHAGPANIPVLANDSDPDDAPNTLALTVSTLPQHGAAIVEADGSITYTPAADWAGADTFRYTLDDHHGGTSIATVTVTTVNAAPAAVDDTVSTSAATAVTVPVLSNDSDPDNDPITVVAVTQPQAGAGTAAIVGGTVRYTPPAGFKGRAAFTYTIQDSHGAQSVAHVYADVANERPTASADRAEAPYKGSVPIQVLANDTDPNHDTLTVTGVGAPDHGTVTLAGNVVTYHAPDGFSGDATFRYTISDGNGGIASADVVVTVADAPPTAGDRTVSTACGAPVRIDALSAASDPNGDTLRVTGNTAPAHGTVSRNNDGTLTYTPDPAFSGTDGFRFTVDDGHGGTATAAVTVTVANGVPVATPDPLTVPAGVPTLLDPLANDTDPNGDKLTIKIDSQPAHGTLVPHADGTFTYTPAAGFHGDDTFHYTVDDGHGGTAGATVSLSVTEYAPVALPDSAGTDSGATVVIPVLANDTDANHDKLTLTSVTAAGHGTVVKKKDGTVAYTPADGFAGTDTFGYTITDATGRTASGVVTVTVRGVPPIAVDDQVVIQPGAPATVVKVLDNDTDPNRGQKISVASVGTAAKGTVVLNQDGTVTYQPNPGASGRDSFQYVITDDLGLTDTANVLVTIDGAPTATPDSVTAKPGTAITISVLTNDTDPEGRPLTLLTVGTPAHGTAVVNADGSIRYTPVQGFNGTDSFPYVVRDPAGNKATGLVTIHVGDAAPVARPDAAAVRPGDHVDVDVLANDTDPNRDPLTIGDVSAPAHGTATVVDGKIRYTPVAGFTGSDTFTYTMSDGKGGTAKASVTVTVSNGPVAVRDERTTPYQHPVTVKVLGNDLDPDGSLGLTGLTQPAHGTATATGNTITYTPADDFSGTDKFSYTVTDAQGRSSTGDVVVTVGTPPVMPPKQVAAKPGQALSIALPLIDKNGRPVTIMSIGTPKHGKAKLNANGSSVTYLADSGFSGQDTFPYKVRDADGNIAVASVIVTVPGVNQAPVAADDVAWTIVDKSVVINLLTNDKDPNDDVLSVASAGKPRHGTVLVGTDGTVTYAPSKEYQGGTDSFTYIVSDGRGGTAKATVTVHIAAATGSTKLPKTGDNVVTVISSGLATIVVGGVLYWAGTGGMRRPILAGLLEERKGRHRPGRHKA